MDNELKISIIVITYNRPADLLELINNIASLNELHLLDEVIILNNKSTADYSAVEKFITENSNVPFRYLVAEENLGVARGRNFAAQKANAPILVFIDDDALFQNKDALTHIRDIFSEDVNKNSGIVAFRIFYQSTMDYQVNAFPHKNFQELKALHHFNTYYFSGCAHAIRKEVLEQAGFYPENFFYGMEEYDLSYRAIDAGFKIVYNDLVTILHKESPTGRLTNKDKLRGMWVNKSKVAWKYLPKKYFISTAFLWSFQYLKKTSFSLPGWFKGWKEISKISSTEKRNPISQKALNYLKHVKARLIY